MKHDNRSSHFQWLGALASFIFALVFSAIANASTAYVFTDLGEFVYPENDAFTFNYDRQVPRIFIAGVPTGGGWGSINYLILPPQDGKNVSGFYANNSGVIAGTSQDVINGQASEAITWDNGAITFLGSAFGQGSLALSINDVSQVVGYSYLNLTNYYGQYVTGYHATLWENESIIDLGTLGGSSSIARSINNVGQVVGGSQTYGDTSPFPNQTSLAATLWENGIAINLNTLIDQNAINDGWYLSQAFGISNNGQIVGTALNPAFGETDHAFLLTPVPIPATFWLFASGLACLLGIKRNHWIEKGI